MVWPKRWPNVTWAYGFESFSGVTQSIGTLLAARLFLDRRWHPSKCMFAPIISNVVVSSSLQHQRSVFSFVLAFHSHVTGFFCSRSRAARSASRSFSFPHSAWPSSCRTARSRRPSRSTRHMSMSSDTRPGGPAISASSKNVVRASKAVRAGTPDLKPRPIRRSFQCSERTSTQFHCPKSVE